MDIVFWMVQNILPIMDYKSHLIFQAIFKTSRMSTGDTGTIIASKSKGLSEINIKPPSIPVTSLVPRLTWIHKSKIAVEFKGSCMKLDKATFTHRYGYVVNLFTGQEVWMPISQLVIACLELWNWVRILILINMVIVVMFIILVIEWWVGKNVVIFGVVNSSSTPCW